MTHQDIINTLRDIKLIQQSAVTYDDKLEASGKIDSLFDAIKEDPSLLSEQVIAGIEAIAQNSPFNDIDQSVHHRQTDAQDICLEAMRLSVPFVRIAPDKSEEIQRSLETLAQSSTDWDIRREALGEIWVISLSKEPRLRERAVTILENQGIKNSDAYLRTASRDNLMQTSREYEDLVPRAMAAQIKGTEDEDPDARTRALALLTNRALSPSCPEAEARSLLAVFEKAATRGAATNEDLAYWVERSRSDTLKRLKEGPSPYKFP